MNKESRSLFVNIHSTSTAGSVWLSSDSICQKLVSLSVLLPPQLSLTRLPFFSSHLSVWFSSCPSTSSCPCLTHVRQKSVYHPCNLKPSHACVFLPLFCVESHAGAIHYTVAIQPLIRYSISGIGEDPWSSSCTVRRGIDISSLLLHKSPPLCVYVCAARNRLIYEVSHNHSITVYRKWPAIHHPCSSSEAYGHTHMNHSHLTSRPIYHTHKLTVFLKDTPCHEKAMQREHYTEWLR